MDSPTLLKPGGDSEQQWLKQIATLLGLIFGTIVLTFCCFASSLCITIVLSAFLAILVDPLVVRLAKIGQPEEKEAAAMKRSGVISNQFCLCFAELLLFSLFGGRVLFC